MSPFDMYSLLYKSLNNEDREFVCSLVLEVARNENKLLKLTQIVRENFGEAIPDNDADLPIEARLERCAEYIMVGLSLKHFSRSEVAKALSLSLDE